MKDVKIIPENINLFYIKVSECIINDSQKDERLNYGINVAHNIQNNLKEEKIRIELILDIKSSDANNEFNANFNIDFQFKIKDLADYYEKDNKEPVFDGLFISTLMGISFSTARGIIFERLSKTNMRNVILPVVSPSKLLFKDQ
ncbi:hypothetical protein Q4Q35_02500 [Flavivirga aquimarina]|uniref:Uncharacterized protein n=1 Tax=Flavivirga aquimarina TaxID=2027862 RepID=A0ABT8W6C2_9FLAO|nr:hypothetical protein [Flavivirga aquimarina]MDO5968668.1 hypothetical protein [Flavivirga aquimarina]